MNKSCLFFLAILLFINLTIHRSIPSINPVGQAILQAGLSKAKQKIAPKIIQTITTTAKSLPLGPLKYASKTIKNSIYPIMYTYIFFGMSVAAYNANYTNLCEYSLSRVSLGKAYTYQQLNSKAVFHMQRNSNINKIFILTSPLQMIDNFEMQLTQKINVITNQSYFEQIFDIKDIVILNAAKYTTNYVKQKIYHWEIAFEIQNLVYLVFSFGSDGLQNVFYGELEHIIGRRKDNQVFFEKQVNLGMEELKNYLLLNENKKYHPINWNCKDFVEGMMDHFKIQVQNGINF